MPVGFPLRLLAPQLYGGQPPWGLDHALRTKTAVHLWRPARDERPNPRRHARHPTIKAMTTEPVDTTRLLLPIHEEDHVHGPASAPYTLVEYGDYECPGCGQLFEIIRDLQTT